MVLRECNVLGADVAKLQFFACLRCREFGIIDSGIK